MIVQVQAQPVPQIWSGTAPGYTPVPSNAILDENGTPIVDENGNYILSD